jgi:nucleotide-binding universal stress UspA family protein
MYKRLLVPLDGSRLAEAVLPIVERLAPAWNATVLLLHILERHAPEAVHGERHLTEAKQAAAYLENIARRLQERAIPVEFHVHDVQAGNVARTIATSHSKSCTEGPHRCYWPAQLLITKNRPLIQELFWCRSMRLGHLRRR